MMVKLTKNMCYVQKNLPLVHSSAPPTGTYYIHVQITENTSFYNKNSMQTEYEMQHRYKPIKYKSYHGNTQHSFIDQVTIT